ncbi:hypothetical protein L1887_50153 [Cichorium endivia]|nr:hypothetical protein L1887_50153 [Cichorium endivia]
MGEERIRLEPAAHMKGARPLEQLLAVVAPPWPCQARKIAAGGTHTGGNASGPSGGGSSSSMQRTAHTDVPRGMLLAATTPGSPHGTAHSRFRAREWILLHSKPVHSGQKQRRSDLRAAGDMSRAASPTRHAFDVWALLPRAAAKMPSNSNSKNNRLLRWLTTHTHIHKRASRRSTRRHLDACTHTSRVG